MGGKLTLVKILHLNYCCCCYLANYRATLVVDLQLQCTGVQLALLQGHLSPKWVTPAQGATGMIQG